MGAPALAPRAAAPRMGRGPGGMGADHKPPESRKDERSVDHHDPGPARDLPSAARCLRERSLASDRRRPYLAGSARIGAEDLVVLCEFLGAEPLQEVLLGVANGHVCGPSAR